MVCGEEDGDVRRMGNRREQDYQPICALAAPQHPRSICVLTVDRERAIHLLTTHKEREEDEGGGNLGAARPGFPISNEHKRLLLYRVLECRDRAVFHGVRVLTKGLAGKGSGGV